MAGQGARLGVYKCKLYMYVHYPLYLHDEFDDEATFVIMLIVITFGFEDMCVEMASLQPQLVQSCTSMCIILSC